MLPNAITTAEPAAKPARSGPWSLVLGLWSVVRSPDFLPLTAFAVLWLDLIRQLSYVWRTNEQYAYGWFVPILALGLFLKKWPTRPRPGPQDDGTTGLRDYETTGLQDYGTTGPQDHGTTGRQDYGTTGPQDHETTGLQDYETTGLQDYETTGLQDYGTTGQQTGGQRAEGRGQRSEVRGQTSEVSGQWSVVSGPVPPSPISHLPAPSLLLSAFRFPLSASQRFFPGRSPVVPWSRSPVVPFLLFAFCFLLLPLRVIYEINADWPLISWLYTLIVVVLTLYALHLADPASVSAHQPSTINSQRAVQPLAFSVKPSPWLRHFAFPVCFILVAVQWPYRLENLLTKGLMGVATSVTVELLGWLDIPAVQHGNLIELATGTVGVDEACSGIRSFQSTLMCALFLGELYLIRWRIRFLLVGVGLLAAFLLNVCRTSLLSWQAAKAGPDALHEWHDPAGFTIAIACFFCLWAIAVLIRNRSTAREKAESRKQKAEIAPADQPQVSALIPHPLIRKAESRKQKAEITPADQPQVSAFIPQPSEASQPSTLNSQLPTDLRPPTSGSSDSQLSTLNSQLPSGSPVVSGPTSPIQPSAFSLQPSPDSPVVPSSRSPVVPSPISHLPSPFLRRYLLAVGCWALVCIAGTEAWYGSRRVQSADPSRWWVNFPTNALGFTSLPLSAGARRMLRCDEEATAAWEEPDGTKWSVFCLRWRAGDPTASISARGHRPEYCMSGSGHRMNADLGIKSIAADGLSLPFRTYIFDAPARPLYVFFCLWEDGAESQRGFAKTKYHDRLRAVLDRRRGPGQQTLEIICEGYQSFADAQSAVTARLPGLLKIESTEH